MVFFSSLFFLFFFFFFFFLLILIFFFFFFIFFFFFFFFFACYIAQPALAVLYVIRQMYSTLCASCPKIFSLNYLNKEITREENEKA